MNINFALLLLSGFLIVICVFCLVFGFDSRKNSKISRILILLGLAILIVLGFLIYFLMKEPLS